MANSSVAICKNPPVGEPEVSAGQDEHFHQLMCGHLDHMVLQQIVCFAFRSPDCQIGLRNGPYQEPQTAQCKSSISPAKRPGCSKFPKSGAALGTGFKHSHVCQGTVADAPPFVSPLGSQHATHWDVVGYLGICKDSRGGGQQYIIQLI
jgi:hypothetical protein